jgi:mono/diheme cytochrome c family protein
MINNAHSLTRILISLVVSAAVAIAVIFIWSSLLLSKKYNVPFTKLNIPTDSASIREGERLIRIAHCRDCHGEHLTGRVFRILKDTTELVGSNITSIISTYSDEELERVIRHGIKRNGTSVFFMPSEMYYELKDESVAKIIAYLRTIKPHPSSPDLPTSTVYFPLGRLQLIRGNFPPRAALIKHTAPRKYANHDTTQVAFGRYLTMTTCSNCHGKDLKGSGKRPNLVIAAAYTKDQFYHLIKTGEGGLGRKELGQMSELAREHFSYLNDSEIGAIFSFLKTLPHRKD